MSDILVAVFNKTNQSLERFFFASPHTSSVLWSWVIHRRITVLCHIGILITIIAGAGVGTRKIDDLNKLRVEICALIVF
jgi:hypothetical protein